MEFPVRNNRENNTNEQLAARYINHTLHLEADGEIINLDYDPIRLYAILQQCNNGFLDETFHQEIIKVLQTYITLRKRVFKIIRTPTSLNNKSFLNLFHIFQKYNIIDQIYGERHMAKAITIPRLMLLFPHVMAKIVTIDLNVETIIPYSVLQESGLSSISPACFWKSSFCLLPKFQADVEDVDQRMRIIKAMLLAQYEQQDIIHEENEYRNRKSPFERMQAILLNCKVVYNSNHILGAIRYTSYTTFFLCDPLNESTFDYNKAAEIFDAKFSDINPVLNNIFKLRKGTGIEQRAHDNDI